jgi:AAA15 family ATPase/GTPase
MLESLNKIIQRYDFGISRVEVPLGPTGPIALFDHHGLAIPMNLENESQGTRKMFGIFPLIHFALLSGGWAILDELDTDIHPNFLPEILGWFYNRESNPHNSQLIMTCHNASVLEHLHPNQVFLTEKDSEGRSRLYGAKEIKGIRRGSNMYREYLGGAYGAVPRMG